MDDFWLQDKNILACLSKVKKIGFNFGNFLKRQILLYIKGQHMKALNILAGNVTMKQLQSEVLLVTKRQCMKELNTFANFAAMK